MNKKAIIPIIIFVLLIISFIFASFYISNKKQEEDFLMLKQKYEPLNKVNLQELDKLSQDDFRKIVNLYYDYKYDIRIKGSKDDRIKTIVLNYDKFRSPLSKEMAKRDQEKRRKFKLDKENKNYERFLREFKRVTDEKIIKEKLARLDTIREIEKKRESNSLSIGDNFGFLNESKELKAGDGISEEEVKERKEFIEFCETYCNN